LRQLDELRVAAHPELARIVVGVDPKAGGAGGESETGIVVVGRDADGHGYVLADYSTDDGPTGWARQVILAAQQCQADAIVAEANQGGAMVETVLRTTEGGDAFPIILVRATRGKIARAEPVAGLYTQGRAHHVGTFAKLEDQLTTYVPGMASPDRFDALVWAFTDLFPSLTGGWLLWD
jgi:phage terminase large subunit-like protein